MEVLYIEDTPIIAKLSLASAEALMADVTILSAVDYAVIQTAGLLADKPILIIHAEDYAGASAYLKHPTSRPNLIVSDFEFPGKMMEGLFDNPTNKPKFTVGGVELYADVLTDYNSVAFAFLTSGEASYVQAKLKERGVAIDTTFVFPKSLRLVDVIEQMCKIYTPVTPGPPGGRAWIPYPMPS